MRLPTRQFGTLASPLDKILGTTGRIRVLRALEVSEGPQTMVGLQRATALTYQGAQRAVDPLVDAGIVEELPTVGARLFRLATKHPFAPGLSALFDAERRRAQAMPALIEGWVGAGRQGLLAVWLFGSVARREDTFRSDVDIALVTESSADATTLGEDLRAAMEAAAGELALRPNVVPYTAAAIIDMATTNDPMWGELVKDTVPLHGARPESLQNELAHGRSGNRGPSKSRKQLRKKS